MTFPTVEPGCPPVKAEDDPSVVLIPAEVHRNRCGGISRTSEWRYIKADPDWPRPVKGPNGQICYVDAESRAYVRKLIAARERAA
jgi:hypothetical protein